MPAACCATRPACRRTARDHPPAGHGPGRGGASGSRPSGADPGDRQADGDARDGNAGRAAATWTIPRSKAEIAAQVLPLIEDVPNPVERDAYRQRLARLLQGG